jgi:homoserine acetyltransferase
MDKILELKSSNNVFNNKYILQCIIYNEINKQSNHDSCIYLFNILTGEMHKVDYHINDLNGFWAKIIRKMSKKNDILED